MFPNLTAAGRPAANGTSTPPSFFSTPRQRSGFYRSFHSWEAYWVIEALKYVLKRIPSFTLTEILLFLGLRGLQGVGDVKDLKWEDLWALGMSKTSSDSILGRDLRNTSLLPQLPKKPRGAESVAAHRLSAPRALAAQFACPGETAEGHQNSALFLFSRRSCGRHWSPPLILVSRTSCFPSDAGSLSSSPKATVCGLNTPMLGTFFPQTGIICFR